MAEVAITKNRQDLERLEGIIERNLQSFYEVGRALMEIRDKGYYRDVLGFDTFEAYCKAKWDMSRPRAYQLIDAVTVKDNLSTIVDMVPATVVDNIGGTIVPVTESQARPLVRLEPDKQREAWREAVETAPEGKITAAHVNKVVKKYRLEGAVETVEKTGAEKAEPEGDLPDDGLKLCDKAIAQMAKIHKMDIYREKAFDQMQAWLDENRLPTADKIQKIRDLEGGIAKASAGELERSPAEPALPLPQDETMDIDVQKNKTYSQCSLAFK